MKNKGLILGFLWAFSGLINPSIANAAQESEYLSFHGNVRYQYLYEDNADLGTRSEDTTGDSTVEGNLYGYYNPTSTIKGFTQIRALKTFGGANFQDETGLQESVDSFVEARQVWFEFSEIADIIPLSVRVGRQRYYEPTSNWWNRDMDSVRAIYDTTLVKGFLGVAQNLRSYRTASDSDFGQDDQDRLRLLGELSKQYRPDQFIDFRFLAEHDHSGTEPTGVLVRTFDRDQNDQDLVWFGTRHHGTFGLLEPKASVEKIAYRADLMGVVGSETLENSTSTSNPARRLVTGNQDKDVRGWAFDGDVSLYTNLPLKPVLYAGYAYGSGDDNPNDGVNHGFRQTDLQGNFTYWNGTRTPARNYGEALRPELSNIHILAAGSTFHFGKASDLSTTYRYYKQATATTTSSPDGISASTDGKDTDLGHGFDVLGTANLTQEFGATIPHFKDIMLRANYGAFVAGDAWETAAEGEVSQRAILQLRLNY
jgi:hypothetical protein